MIGSVDTVRSGLAIWGRILPMTDPNLIVQIVVAFGTISAVVVALFQTQLRLKFAPPHLKISLLSSQGHRTDVHLFPPGTNDPGQSRIEAARFYHIHVENNRRWSTANQVQVFLSRIDLPGPDGDMRVAWLGEIPMRWRYQDAKPIHDDNRSERGVRSVQPCPG